MDGTRKRTPKVAIDAIGVQLGRHRFPESRADQASLKPALAQWRTGLTALSQDFNLYLVAYLHLIYVYQPLFPTQEFPADPALIIDTAPSTHGLRGYLDPHHPHTINNLVVQYLGRDEVMAVVRDDGDVDTYFTRHICEAIERRSQPDTSIRIGPLATELRPFLHKNVGNSAWGLAVHTEARLIAVSSNNHEFNVFSFGLAKNLTPGPDSFVTQHEEDQTPRRESQNSDIDEAQTGHNHSLKQRPPQSDSSQAQEEHTTTQSRKRQRQSTGIGNVAERTLDEHHVIHNGDQNIPFIAFCNTGDDPDGRWLLTTDISGLVRSWDFRAERSQQAFQIGFQGRIKYGFDGQNAGWGLAFLDPRSFREVAEMPIRLSESQPIWNVSANTANLEASSLDFYPISCPVIDLEGDFAGDEVIGSGSQRLPWTRDADTEIEYLGESDEDDYMISNELEPRAGTSSGEQLSSIDFSIGESEDEGMYDGEIDSGTSEDGNDNEVYDQVSNDGDMTGDDVEEDDDGLSEAGPPSHDSDQRSQELSQILDQGRPTQQRPPPDAQTLRRFIASLSDDTIRDELRNARRQLDAIRTSEEGPIQQGRKAHMWFSDSSALCPDLPCPILHFSVRDMYMLQPGSKLEDMLPVTMLSDIWTQKIMSSRAQYLDCIERCSMHAQIPSLGVIIVGNQKGRVAVISLIKARHQTRLVIRPRPGRKVTHVDADKFVYGMRVECMLPYRSQEEAGYRPFAPLHGIAVGPVQGTEGLSDDRKRWRLMLMYQTHTVLSYEIKRNGGDDSLDIRDVML